MPPRKPSPAFLTAPEAHAFIAKRKDSLAKKFSLGSMSNLFDYVQIAWLLVASERYGEARAMCDWLGESVTFSGNFNVWTPVAKGIALSARLARMAGDDPGPHQARLAAHPALAVMDRPRFEAWVAEPIADIRESVEAKPSQSTTLSLASDCAAATYFREAAVPGIYWERWLDKAAFDAAIDEGVAAMAKFLQR